MGKKLPGLIRYPQTIDEKGRVLIPKPLRDRLDWKANTWVEVYEANGKIVLERIKL